MDQNKKAGLIQLFFVIVFIVGAMATSKLLESTYKPPKQEKQDERILFVETQELESIKHRIVFKATGMLEARHIITITPQVSGRVIKVHDAFSAGGSFNKEDVLFQIDPRDFELNIQKAEAEVAQNLTKLNIEKAESAAALAEWNQVNGNKPAPDLVARKPQMMEAEANLKSAQAKLEDAQLALTRTKFTLPFDGRVLESSISEGQYISAGQSYGKVFDRQSLEVQTSLEDQQLEWLLSTKDPKIDIVTTYLGQTKTHKASLQRQASFLDPTTRFATVRFALDETPTDLLPGTFADIKIEGQELDTVMLLPSSAIQSGNIVWIVRDNLLHKWIPKVIYENDDMVAVQGISNALTKLNIVTSRLSGGIDGMQVRTK